MRKLALSAVILFACASCSSVQTARSTAGDREAKISFEAGQGTADLAHRNAIDVLVDKKPVRASRRSAEWCREGVETCWKRKSEKDAAKAAHDEALTIHDRLIKECFDDR
jgi:hypothetical protein